MTGRWISAVLATAVALTSAPAAGQPATNVAPVTVSGIRRPPPEMTPLYTACLEAIRDPTTRALVSMGGMGPVIYTETRPVRQPNYSAPPRTPPGSALPNVMSLREYGRYIRRLGVNDAAAAGVELDGLEGSNGAADTGGAAADLGGPGATRGLAMAECMGISGGSLYTGGGDPNPFARAGGTETGPGRPMRPGGGRLYISLTDKTLPLGFALFEDGRYEEALVQFRANDRKIGAAEGRLAAAKIYLFALGAKSDPVQGVAWLKKVADGYFDPTKQTPIFDPKEPERNTALGEAAMLLAEIYREGRGPVPKDPAQSRKYLERAYEVGHIRAAKILGDIYYQGIDTPKDLNRAFKHYRDAAKFAYAPAMMAVAQMYEAGEVDGRPNPARALAWRSEAAKVDDPKALYALAVAYDRGQGVTADPERALSLYKLAAMNKEPAAMTALGTYFYRGEVGLPLDHVTARRWFEQAAIAEDVDGMFNLAAMLAKGEGGKIDRARAWAWLKIAEKQGHPNATAAVRAVEGEFTAADRAAVKELTGVALPGRG